MLITRVVQKCFMKNMRHSPDFFIKQNAPQARLVEQTAPQARFF